MTEDPRAVQIPPPEGHKGWEWGTWGLGLLLLVLGFALWEPFPPGIWHDDGVYVMLGRSLAEGEGLRYLGVEGAPLAPKFPPLFPLLLGLAWLVFPSFPDNVPVLSSINLLLLAGAGSLFVAYLRNGLGIRPQIALPATALAWIAPQMWRVSLIPLSEPLFLFSLVLALWLGARMERRGGWAPVALFLLGGGLTVYTRTLGAAVLLAGVIATWSRGRRRAALGLGLGSAVVILPWVFWARWAAASVPATLQDTLGPYGPWLVDQAGQYPGEYLSFLAANAGHLVARILSLLLPGVAGGATWWGLLLLPFLLLGMMHLWKTSRVLPLALAGSLAILLIWPFQHIRLLVPFHPILILGTVLGLFRAIRWLSEPGCKVPHSFRVRAVVGVAAVAWLGGMVSVSVFRLATGWPGQPYRIRSEALATAVRAVEEHTPPDAVVGAPELWSGVHLYTGRSVVPSARFRPLVPDHPPGGTVEEQVELWIDRGVTHLVVEHGGTVHGDALDRIDTLCPPGTVQLLDDQPGQFLVGLDWDAACQRLVLEGPGTGAGDGKRPRPQ